MRFVSSHFNCIVLKKDHIVNGYCHQEYGLIIVHGVVIVRGWTNADTV